MPDYEHIKAVYQTSLYKNILHEINGVVFPFSERWQRVGVSLSGGADSALMAVLLCSIITQKLYTSEVHIITNIRCWKTRPWQKQNSLDVFHWLVDNFPTIKFTRHENFIAPDCGLMGTIPSAIGNLQNLQQLNIQDNQLVGIVPESICDLNINWSFLSNFNISENQFCPPYPYCIEDYVGNQDTSGCN